MKDMLDKDNKICGNCISYDEWTGICLNPESDIFNNDKENNLIYNRLCDTCKCYKPDLVRLNKPGKEDIIGEDFQGWPIYKQSLRNVLHKLGFTENTNNDGSVSFTIQDKDLLDRKVITMEDDGMGYCINDEYVVEAFPNEINGENCITFIRDNKDSEIIEKYGIKNCKD